MSNYIELEIQSILNEIDDLDYASDRLIHNLESSDSMDAENITALAKFLYNAKAHSKLVHFCIKLFQNEKPFIPWPYLFEAMEQLTLKGDTRFVDALIEGLEETHSQLEAARSKVAAQYIPEAAQWAVERRYQQQKSYEANKKVYLEQLVMLRTQQLYEQEKKLLGTMQKMFPGDPDVNKEVREHKQRYALEILQKRSPKKVRIKTEDLILKDPEVEKALNSLMESILEKAHEFPEIAFDLAIAAFMFERFEDCLEVLNLSSEEGSSVIWLRLEALLQARHFIELLNDLAKVEVLLAHEPETFFATAYLRAQALWGLGQKHTAIEVMEGLLASRPHYRAASALLSIWSQQ